MSLFDTYFPTPSRIQRRRAHRDPAPRRRWRWATRLATCATTPRAVTPTSQTRGSDVRAPASKRTASGTRTRTSRRRSNGGAGARPVEATAPHGSIGTICAPVHHGRAEGVPSQRFPPVRVPGARPARSPKKTGSRRAVENPGPPPKVQGATGQRRHAAIGRADHHERRSLHRCLRHRPSRRMPPRV